jgi:hypothetical protein
MFKKPAQAIEELTPHYDFNSALDISAGTQTADAQVGAVLLVLGFLGQLASALGYGRASSWRTVCEALVAAGLFDLLAVVFLTRFWQRHHVRGMLAARLVGFNDFANWWPALSIYGAALGYASDGGVTETVAAFGARVLGSRGWERLTHDLALPGIYTKLRHDIPGTPEFDAIHGEGKKPSDDGGPVPNES